jgi:hypothetical protein
VGRPGSRHPWSSPHGCGSSAIDCRRGTSGRDQALTPGGECHVDDLMSLVQSEDQRVRGTVQNLVHQARDDTIERSDTVGIDCDFHVRFKATL